MHSYHNLLYELRFPKTDELRVVKRGRYFTSCYSGQSLNAVKVCVFNRHHASLTEELLGKVVNELRQSEAWQGTTGLVCAGR